VDDIGTTYRAHHDYRSSGAWHDWAWVSYSDNSPKNQDGFRNVPAKILIFVDLTCPSIMMDAHERTIYAVCHPCHFQNKRLSPLINQWNLVSSSDGEIRGYPFDMVPVEALVGHTLVIPDNDDEGTIYQVIDHLEWAGNM
jgi:hypothetical protein